MQNWSYTPTDTLEAEAGRIAAELQRRRLMLARAKARALQKSLSHQVHGLQSEMQQVVNLLSSMRR